MVPDRGQSGGGSSPTDEPEDPLPAPISRDGHPSAHRIAEAIGHELLGIHQKSYGGSAENVETHFVGDTLIVILDGLELLPAEELLVSQGEEDAVATMRSRYQRAIESTFRAAVERSSGRTVVAFASHVHLDEPRFAVEIFRLGTN